MRLNFKNYKTIVVKVGTNLLTSGGQGLNLFFIHSLAKQITQLSNEDKNIILVSSGAIFLGRQKLNKTNLLSLPEKQAAAAVGQAELMQLYIRHFNRLGKNVAQILLTRDDVADRRRYLNVRGTFLTLFKEKVITIVNENDTVSTEEIKEMKFGDNDTLSALVASLIKADLLVILSDVDGLYNADPFKDKNAKFIPEIKFINDEIEKYAGGKRNDLATGGMKAKIKAAKITTYSGCPMVLAKGSEKNIITRIINGEKFGSLFYPQKLNLNSRKCWIGFCLPRKGEIYINYGAENALVKNQKSLLPSGIIKIIDNFKSGDNVKIYGEKNNFIGSGIVNHSANLLKKIVGLKTSETEKVLGYKIQDEVIHRDNLVILQID